MGRPTTWWPEIYALARPTLSCFFIHFSDPLPSHLSVARSSVPSSNTKASVPTGRPGDVGLAHSRLELGTAPCHKGGLSVGDLDSGCEPGIPDQAGQSLWVGAQQRCGLWRPLHPALGTS